MSLDVLTAIWRAPPCKGGDLLCLLAIADNADEFGYAWPSIATIAKKAAMGERGAQKCVQKLAGAGLISIKRGGGRNKTNAYQITTNGIGVETEHTNPEQNTPNKVHPLPNINPEQSCINPEPAFAKPRTPVHPNSQEPPIEPSLPLLSPIDILSSVVRRETAVDFSAHRKSLKKPLTDIAARRLVKAVEFHHDPDSVFDLSIQNGWQGIFPERSSNERTDTRTPQSDPALRAIAAAATAFEA